MTVELVQVLEPDNKRTQDLVESGKTDVSFELRPSSSEHCRASVYGVVRDVVKQRGFADARVPGKNQRAAICGS
jgi:hypothetical protein